MEQAELDLVVLSQLQAIRKLLHQHVKSQLVQSTCRENAFAVTLMFVRTISQKRYHNLFEHFACFKRAW